MAAYAVTDFLTSEGALPTVLAALETQQETIDNGKTIRMTKVVYLPNGNAIGIIIYDA
jgi:hypothetical protein